MSLPLYLREVIEKKIHGIPLSKLTEYAEELTRRYRSDNFILQKDLLLAYLAFRFPATFSVVADVLEKVVQKNPFLEIGSFLDLGCGPCTGLFAVQEFFENVEKVTLVEKDKHFFELGKLLVQEAIPSLVSKCSWVQKDIETLEGYEPHDLVLFSYSLGELSPHQWKGTVQRAWDSTKKILVIIEPGTPRNFERIKEARQLLLSLGGSLLAPCPTGAGCPMQKGDWCHFSSRVERSSLHRKCKQAYLGYEDEKFSYLVFSKQVTSNGRARILRHPIKKPGLVSLTLCESGESKIVNIPHREREAYKKARKASWGEEWGN